MIWTTRQRSEGAGRLAYWRQGAGPALVLIHGVGLRAEAWGAMLPHLARRYTVFAVDMPGHGHSPLAGASGLGDYVRRVAEFSAALDGPVYLAGHSMGAIVALGVAFELPKKTAGVAALNAIYRRTHAAATAVQARADALGKGMSDPAPTLARWFGDEPTGDLKQARDACQTWLTQADPQGYATAYRTFAEQDGPLDADLAGLEVPALFVTGQHDLNSIPAMSQAMAAIAPHGQACALAAAHMMPMTHGKAVADILIEGLAA